MWDDGNIVMVIGSDEIIRNRDWDKDCVIVCEIVPPEVPDENNSCSAT